MTLACKAVLAGLALLAGWAEAVHLDAMADDVVLRGAADAVDDLLDVRQVHVLRRTAADADEVVVVRAVGGAIAHGAVIQDNTADDSLVDQQLQRAVDGRASDRRQLGGQLLRREVLVSSGNGLDDRVPRRRDLVSLVAQVVQQKLRLGLRCHELIIAVANRACPRRRDLLI